MMTLELNENQVRWLALGIITDAMYYLKKGTVSSDPIVAKTERKDFFETLELLEKAQRKIEHELRFNRNPENLTKENKHG